MPNAAPRLGKLLALLALSFAPAFLFSTHVSASPSDAPLAAALSIDITWQVAVRDSSPAFFPARYLYTEMCDASGAVCFPDSVTLLDANGQATLATTEYPGGDVTFKLWSSAVVNGNDIVLYDAPPEVPDVWQILTQPIAPFPAIVASVPFGSSLVPAWWLMDDFVESFLKVPILDQPNVVFQGYWRDGWESHGILFAHADRSFFCYDAPFGFCDEAYLYLFSDEIRAPPEADEVGLPNRVAIHESGHAVQYWMYGEKMPAQATDYWLWFPLPPPPCVNWDPRFEITGEPDCAWQEGWADFWRIYVLGTPILQGLNSQLDYETAIALIDDGDEVPGRITAALWDIHDSVSDGTDAFAFGFDATWDSLKNYAFAADGLFDNTFIEYWATWRGRNTMGGPSELNQCAVTSIFQNTITYSADAWLRCGNAQVGFQKVGASGGAVSGPEDPGGAGIITGLIDSFEFDEGDGWDPSIVNVSGDVYAIAYTSPGTHGNLITTTIDSAGKIGPVIDTLEYESGTARTPFLFHVSDNIYGIAYDGNDGDGFLAAVDITPSGVIGAAVVDELEFDTTQADDPFVLNVSGDIYAIVYDGGTASLFTVTVDIDPTGTPLSLVDGPVSHPGSSNSAPSIVNVSGDIYAIAYQKRFNHEGNVLTRTISPTGTIGAVIEDFEFDPAVFGFGVFHPFVMPVSGNIYAIFYQGVGIDGFVTTVDIDPSGTPISPVEQFEFDTNQSIRVRAVHVGDDLFAACYRGSATDGFIQTLTIPATGVGMANVDNFEFDTDQGTTCRPILVTGTGGPGTVIANVYTGPANDGFVKTVAIGADGYARVPLALMDLHDIFNGQSVEATDGIVLFDSKVTYDPAGIQVLRVGYGEGFAEGPPPIIDNATGTAQLAGLNLSASPNLPIGHGFVYPRLIGLAAQPYTLQWDAAGQPAEPYEYSWTRVGAELENTEQITFRRGDLNGDAAIAAVDVTMLQRAIVGTTLPCGDLANPVSGCVNPADAASVKWDDCAVGDRINVYDAIVLQQMIDGTIGQLPTTCGGLHGSGSPATVTIATTTVATAATGSVPITVSNVTDLDGLAGYTVEVQFDTSVISVDRVTRGQAPFGLTPTANIDNLAGTVLITFAIGDSPGPTGTLEIANLNFTAAATPGTTTLDLTVRNLASSTPKEIPSSAVDGVVVVE